MIKKLTQRCVKRGVYENVIEMQLRDYSQEQTENQIFKRNKKNILNLLLFQIICVFLQAQK